MIDLSANAFVTVRVADQILGIPVLQVHDVFRQQAMTRVPRAPAMVAGVMNLRGRIVTAIDVRARLSLPPRGPSAKSSMCVVIEQDRQPYALIVDGVGDVVPVDPAAREPMPVTLGAAWRAVATGVYRLDRGLLVAVDVAALLDVEAIAA